GTLVLQVIAYRGNLASDPVAITVNVKDQAAQVTATVAAPAGPTAPVYTDPTCRARVDVNGLNFRQGPGQNYPPLSVLGLGTTVIVTGRTTDLTWWQGRIGSTLGWMSASFITLFGSLCNVVPVAQAPASPVPSATIGNTPAATVISATTASGLPNLVVTNIEGPVSIILDVNNTKTATYKVTVTNNGSIAAGAFNAGMVLPDGTLRDIGAVAGLAPGQQAVFQTDITFSVPGSARITALADINQVVTESNESDNLRNYDVVLIKPTPVQQAITPTP
ncbi:MAG: CARDB domain-containing protein, partial [Chloroflexota bacterium]